MNQARVIYHIARADFLERVRRYSFLIMLGLVVFLGYQTAIGNITLQLGQYRGEYNSAWVGAMMAVIANFFLGWFGFYLVKGSVARDRETGVGQIIATTPMTRPVYMIGKWLSNLAVLMSMVATLALMGIAIQFWMGESTQIDLGAFLSPFLFIVLPLMALVAAVAVLFEAIPFLQSGFGNFVYFFLFIVGISAFIENMNPQTAVFEPIGLIFLHKNMEATVTAAYPDYSGGFSLGTTDEMIINTFTWSGIQWTSRLILARFSFIGLSLLLTLLGALFFDRFDTARAKPRRTKTITSSRDTATSPAASPVAEALSSALTAVRLTPLATAARRFNFFNVLTAELKLLLKGLRWWWYAVAGILIIVSFTSPSETTRQLILPLAWLWPLLVWSAIGSREIHNNVQQMTFSSAAPLWRQLPAQWLAGFIVTLLVASGALLRLLVDGDTTGLLALLSGAIFIPSLALASGVWSGTSKLFEILYITLWYIGPLNKVLALDFIGANNNGRPGFFIPLSLLLMAFAAFGRARQIRS